MSHATRQHPHALWYRGFQAPVLASVNWQGVCRLLGIECPQAPEYESQPRWLAGQVPQCGRLETVIIAESKDSKLFARTKLPRRLLTSKISS